METSRLRKQAADAVIPGSLAGPYFIAVFAPVLRLGHNEAPGIWINWDLLLTSFQGSCTTRRVLNSESPWRTFRQRKRQPQTQDLHGETKMAAVTHCSIFHSVPSKKSGNKQQQGEDDLRRPAPLPGQSQTVEIKNSGAGEGS